MADREDDEGAGGFLSRWSRRKAGLQAGRPVAEPAAPPPPAVAAPRPAPAPVPVPVAEPAVEPAPPPPSLEDAQALTPGSDVRRFVRPEVDPAVRNTALKKLFADPHFNVMDGLDVYIEDYGRPDPLPPSMLRQMVQAHALGLFRDEEEAPATALPPPVGETAAAAVAAADPTAPTLQPHEDADLRLQPDDAAGPADAGPAALGAGEDTGREP